MLDQAVNTIKGLRYAHRPGCAADQLQMHPTAVATVASFAYVTEQHPGMKRPLLPAPNS